MKTEIERKFLVRDESYKTGVKPHYVRQGFLNVDRDRVVRVRIVGPSAVITIKNSGNGISRNEFEYEIPLDDAVYLIDHLCIQPTMEKNRYLVPFGDHTWEVDEFLGDNEGLTVAEIELRSEDEPFERPPWLGEEVTHDERYYNASLARTPYKNWGVAGK